MEEERLKRKQGTRRGKLSHREGSTAANRFRGLRKSFGFHFTSFFFPVNSLTALKFLTVSAVTGIFF